MTKPSLPQDPRTIRIKSWFAIRLQIGQMALHLKRGGAEPNGL